MKLVSDNPDNNSSSSSSSSSSFSIKLDGAAEGSDLYALIWPQAMDGELSSTDRPPTKLSIRAGKRIDRHRGAPQGRSVNNTAGKKASRRMLADSATASSLSHGHLRSIQQQAAADATWAIADDAAVVLLVDSTDKAHLVGDTGPLNRRSPRSAAVATQSQSTLVLYSEPWHLLPQWPHGRGLTIDEALLTLDTSVGLVLARRRLERPLLPTKFATLATPQEPLSLMDACDATTEPLRLQQQEATAVAAQSATIRGIQSRQLLLDAEELELSGAQKFYLIFCDRQSSMLQARQKSEDSTACSVVIASSSSSSSRSSTSPRKEDHCVEDNRSGGTTTSVVGRSVANEPGRVRQLERRLATAERLLARSQAESAAMLTRMMQTVSLQATQLLQDERCCGHDDKVCSQSRKRMSSKTKVKRRRSSTLVAGAVVVVVICALAVLLQQLLPIRLAIQAAIDDELVPF